VALVLPWPLSQIALLVVSVLVEQSLEEKQSVQLGPIRVEKILCQQASALLVLQGHTVAVANPPSVGLVKLGTIALFRLVQPQAPHALLEHIPLPLISWTPLNARTALLVLSVLGVCLSPWIVQQAPTLPRLTLPPVTPVAPLLTASLALLVPIVDKEQSLLLHVVSAHTPRQVRSLVPLALLGITVGATRLP
jgi:hypothetical protein